MKNWIIVYKDFTENIDASIAKKIARETFRNIIRINASQKHNYVEVRVLVEQSDEGEIRRDLKKFESRKALLTRMESLRACDSREVEIINGKIVFLGTHITPKSLKAGFYYSNVQSGNDFWRLLDCCLPENENESFDKLMREYNSEYFLANDKNAPKVIDCRNRIKRLLNKYKIGLSDVIGYCECSDSSDGSIVNDIPNNEKYQNLQKVLNEADYIVFNGSEKSNNGAYAYFKKYKFTFKGKQVFVMSSSNMNTACFNAKAEDWKNKLKTVIEKYQNK